MWPFIYGFIMVVCLLVVVLLYPNKKQALKDTLQLSERWLQYYQNTLTETDIQIIRKHLNNLKHAVDDKKSYQTYYQAFYTATLNIYKKYFKIYSDKTALNDILKTTFTKRFVKDQAVFVPKENLHGLVFDINHDDGTYIVCDAVHNCFRLHEIDIIEKTT